MIVFFSLIHSFIQVTVTFFAHCYLLSLLVTHCYSFRQSGLEELTFRMAKSAITCEEECIGLREKIDKTEETISDKRDELSMLEGNVTKAELSCKKAKEVRQKQPKDEKRGRRGEETERR